MSRNSVHVAGELATWPSKDELALILSSAGLRVTVGRYSIRVDDCSHFVFQEYGDDIGTPVIDADADSVAEMIQDATRVSIALACADLTHHFAILNENNEAVSYLHHKCPKEK